MYGLTTIKGSITRGGLKQRLAAFAIAAFISLAAPSAPAQAQVGDYIFLTGNTVEVAQGHTIRVHYDTGYGNRIAIRGTVKVFSGASGALLQSHELTSTTPGLYSIEINRDDLREAGEPGTGCLQLWIVAAISSGSSTLQGAEESGVLVLRSTFELINNESGRTTVNGGIWKTTNFLTVN
jgi:hypothetical protein